jgi:hypothetical protein
MRLAFAQADCRPKGSRGESKESNQCYSVGSTQHFQLNCSLLHLPGICADTITPHTRHSAHTFAERGPDEKDIHRITHHARPALWHDFPRNMFDRAQQAANRSARQIADNNATDSPSESPKSASSPSSSSRKVKRSMSSHAGPTPFHRRISYIPRDAKEWRPKFKWHIYDNQGR